MKKMLAKCILVCCSMFAAGSALAAESAAAARDKLMQEVKAWVGVQSGVSTDRVEVAPLDARMRVASCPAGAKLDFPFPARDLVRARCEAPAWQVFIPVSVRVPRNMIVAGANLARGHVLTEADLASREAAGTDGFEDRASVVGRVLKRELAKGNPILARDLEDAMKVVRITAAVKAGDALKAESYRLETVARALAPVGAAPGVTPAEGSRAVRDLPAGHILLAEELSEGRRVLVARQSLSAGQLIEATMFEPGMTTSRDRSQRYYMEFGGLEFNELTRNIQAGEPLRPGDVRPALLVRRGQSVILTVSSSGGLQVTLRAEAQNDARMGEQVQLKNPESGRTLGGIVTGKGTARGM